MAFDALELSDPDNAPLRCQLMLSLGEAEARAGNTPQAKAIFLQAAEIARSNRLTHQLARASAGYGGRFAWGRAGDDHRLVPLLEEGLAALADEDVELRARLLARLAGALRDEPTRDRRGQVSREAVELARCTGNPAALVYALDGRVLAILAPDSHAEALTVANELRELSQRIGDKERELQGHIYEFIVQLCLGEVRRAEVGLVEARRLADEIRQPGQAWLVRTMQAQIALGVGQLREAERLISEALAFGERVHPEVAIPAHTLQRYALCEYRGGFEDVLPGLHDLVAKYPERRAVHCALPHLHAQLGQRDQAMREFTEFANSDFTLPFDMEWLYGMSMLAETCSLLGDRNSAATLYRLLLPYQALNAADSPEGMRGSVARYLGQLAALLGDHAEAAAHFEDAIVMNKRMSARPWLAHTQHDYAQLLHSRNGPGDQERAENLQAAARATYNELGMREPD
jgi:tetratricopeptide (TPR) repeat protein